MSNINAPLSSGKYKYTSVKSEILTHKRVKRQVLRYKYLVSSHVMLPASIFYLLKELIFNKIHSLFYLEYFDKFKHLFLNYKILF